MTFASLTFARSRADESRCGGGGGIVLFRRDGTVSWFRFRGAARRAAFYFIRKAHPGIPAAEYEPAAINQTRLIRDGYRSLAAN